MAAWKPLTSKYPPEYGFYQVCGLEGVTTLTLRVHVPLCIYTCVYVYIYIYVYIYVCMCNRDKSLHVHIYIYMYKSCSTYIYIYIYIRIYMYIYVYSYMFIFLMASIWRFCQEEPSLWCVSARNELGLAPYAADLGGLLRAGLGCCQPVF